MRLVHISDLHVSGHNYVPEWGEKVLDTLSSMRPDIVIISGDLTDEGYPHEYDVARSYTDRIDVENKIVVPGNHDARNAGYSIFEEMFGTRFPYYENDDIAILGLDSTEPDIDDGHIGRENYRTIEEKLSVRGKRRILALHHHLIAIPGTGRERNIAVDAGQVLRLCTQLGVDFTLSGHRHMPWVWRLEDTYFITAGTATSRRLKGRSHPSFNVMEIEGKRVILNEINVADGSSREILRI